MSGAWLVQRHAADFIAHTEASTGARLPRFVEDEFDAFLECGILAHGFLRRRCGECGHGTLRAFSCERRGFCPSCGARRMSQTAVHRVDHVIPQVPVRQWVLSLPIRLRLLLAAQPELITPAGNLNVHLHVPGAGRGEPQRRRGGAESIEAAAPTDEALHALLHTGATYAPAREQPHPSPGPCIQAGMSRCPCNTRHTSRWSGCST